MIVAPLQATYFILFVPPPVIMQHCLGYDKVCTALHLKHKKGFPQNVKVIETFKCMRHQFLHPLGICKLPEHILRPLKHILRPLKRTCLQWRPAALVPSDQAWRQQSGFSLQSWPSWPQSTLAARKPPPNQRLPSGTSLIMRPSKADMKILLTSAIWSLNFTKGAQQLSDLWM